MKFHQNENQLSNSHLEEILQNIQNEKVFKNNLLNENLNKVHEIKIIHQNEIYIMIHLQRRTYHKMNLKNSLDEI